MAEVKLWPARGERVESSEVSAQRVLRRATRAVLKGQSLPYFIIKVQHCF